MNKHNYDNEIACPSQTGKPSQLSDVFVVGKTFCRLLEARVLSQCVARFFPLRMLRSLKEREREGKAFLGWRKKLSTRRIQFSIKLSRVHISSRLRLADVLLLCWEETLFLLLLLASIICTHQQVEQQSQINLIDKLAEWRFCDSTKINIWNRRHQRNIRSASIIAARMWK